MPVVRRLYIKYLFHVYLIPVSENFEKVQETKWGAKKQGRSNGVLLFQVTIEIERP